MHDLRRLALVALVATFAGCALTKVDPETPRLTLPEALPTGQPTTGGDAVSPTASLPDPWWQLFKDPELDGLIAEALQRNADVAVAAARVAQARAEANVARGDRLPSVDVSAGASRSIAELLRPKSDATIISTGK